jgi:hypothetical protein
MEPKRSSFALEDLNLERIWPAGLFDQRSRHSLYAKAGFTKEGTMKRAAFIHGKWLARILWQYSWRHPNACCL